MRPPLQADSDLENQSEGVAWTVSGRIGRIVLCRPERANALTLRSGQALTEAIAEVLAAQPAVIVLSAQGRVFCAGGDIEAFAAAGPNLPALVDKILNQLHPALLRLANAAMPVVSVVNGPVGGAGLGLALCADFVLAAQSFKLRTGYAAIGLSPDLGSSYFLARRVGALRAQRWLMLSEVVNAEECLASGVIDALIPDAELAAAAERLVVRLASASRGSLAAIKQLCAGLPGRDLPAHLDLEHRLLAACASQADAQEGIAAFVEKRAPRFAP